jgi:glycine cleavage system H protein
MMEDEFKIPQNLHYTEEHEWVLIEGAERVRIGITDYAQRSLHEIVFIEVPEDERLVKRMEPIGTAESVKAVSEIYSPLSGRVVAVNRELEMSPELVNQDPYGKGWIIIIEPSNLETELPGLLTSTQYAEYLKEALTQKRP